MIFEKGLSDCIGPRDNRQLRLITRAEYNRPSNKIKTGLCDIYYFYLAFVSTTIQLKDIINQSIIFRTMPLSFLCSLLSLYNLSIFFLFCLLSLLSLYYLYILFLLSLLSLYDISIVSLLYIIYLCHINQSFSL